MVGAARSRTRVSIGSPGASLPARSVATRVRACEPVVPVGGVVLLANEDDPARPWHLVVLCQDLAGYRNLSQLLTRAYLEGQSRGEPLVRREWLTADSCAGLIALSGGLHGDVGHALHNDHYDLAQSLLDGWQAVFGDRYYLELIRTGRPGEEDTE